MRKLPLLSFVFVYTVAYGVNTINGTDGHDVIDGTPGDDVIIGGPGYDTLDGLAGDDTFMVNGIEQGFDTIIGGAGQDVILGSAGDDDFNLYGLNLASGIERIDGQTGVNRIMGSDYDHTWDFSNVQLINISEVNGQGGHDTITGSQGNDVIIGGPGYDTLAGEAGDDVFLIFGQETSFDSIKGGPGFDVIQGSEHDDDISLFSLNQASSIERIDGGNGFNRILGDNYDHTWDFSNVELLNINEINGQQGHDNITGSAANDIIIGGPGYDTLNGGMGDDIFKVIGHDHGFDTIKGGTGFDIILGSDGDDDFGLYTLNNASSIERIDGGSGQNRIMGSGYDGTWDFSQVELINIAAIDGQGGHDNITGSIAGDVIIGGPGYDTLNGGGGDDTFLIAGKDDGFDSIKGGSGFDVIQGGADDEDFGLYTLNDASSIERIDGGMGLNRILGSNYDHTWDFTNVVLLNISAIHGQGGHDNITGSADNDVIIGGAGYDTLSGGDGDDTFLLEGNDDYDNINGGAGFDVILAGDGDDNIGLFSLTTSNSIEKIDGGTGHNQIVGLNYDHSWDFTHTQLINISAIRGEGGHDSIIGSAANDTISGGTGYDTINGGEGSDTYLFDFGHGTDQLTDSGSRSDSDRVIFGDGFGYGLGLAKENIWFSMAGDNLRIDIIGSNDAIIIANWQPNDTKIESFFTQANVLEASQIHALLSAMSEFSPPQGQDAQMSPSMKSVLYPLISAAWNNDNSVDSDGDGVDDALDAFPNDPLETVDSDGDGVGDNGDAFPNNAQETTDSDGDGTGDNSDAFVNNKDASIDSDGDGAPDAWNASCDASCQQASSLQLDAFPTNPNEWLDTDGDGEGNNTDTDSDNDGFSNQEEIAQGTDPLDPTSYPQLTMPTISLLVDNDQQVDTPQIYVSGIVTPGSLAIARAYLYKSDDPANISFLNISSDGTFTSQLNLLEGTNEYTLLAEDTQGNKALASFKATFTSAFELLSVTPASGITLQDEVVLITAQVNASSDIQLKINQVPADVEKISATHYKFTLAVPLTPGANQLNLQISSVDKALNQVLEYTYQPADMSEYPAPLITLQSPTVNSRTAKAQLPLIAQVASKVGGIELTLNGNALQAGSSDETSVNIAEQILLSEGDNHFELTATDALNQTTTLGFEINRDNQAPVISVQGDYLLPPQVNALPSTAFRLAGTVSAGDLASFTIQGNKVVLSELSNGNYEFEHDLRISAQQDNLVELEAVDSLGNQSTMSYYFHGNNNLNMAWVTPVFPAQWIIEMGTQRPFAIKLAEENGDESYAVELISSTQTLTIPHEKVGDLLVGSIVGVQDAGEYQVRVSATANGQLMSELIGKVTVISQEDVALEVIKLYPLPESRDNETDTFMQVNFNRPIDVSKLDITVRRTLHGLTYQNLDAPGVDFLHAKGQQLVEVNLDRELVPGGISILPDNSSFAFYPQQDLGYTAEVDWQVKYDGQVVAKQRFKTRALPTVIDGGVKDSLGQSIQGVTVEITKLGLSTVTNSDGAFSFGYGASANNNIKGGSYNITVNSNFIFEKLGEINIPVEIKQGRRNQLPLLRVPNLSNEIPWINTTRSASQVNLAQGDVIIKLNGAKLDFPGTHSAIHAQFVPTNGVVRQVYPGSAPLWFYQLQPFGIQVNGPVDIEIKAPKLRGTLDYLGILPGEKRYSFLLGYNQTKDVIEPVGVVEIKDGKLKTLTPIEMSTLDYLGYTHTHFEYQQHFKRFVDGEIGFTELVAKVAVD